jgi:RNA polymerase sigma factor (sigma-70 family)
MMSIDPSENGRREHWARLSVDLYPRLLVMARALTTNDLNPEDLVQETILRCLKYAPDLNKIKEPLRYFRQAMRNVWIDSIRSENGHRSDPLISELPDTAHPVVEPNVLRLLENEELMKSLKVKQGPLTDEERHLLTLRIQGLTTDEIAKVLNEDIRVTRYRCNALMAKLRYRVKQEIKREAARK